MALYERFTVKIFYRYYFIVYDKYNFTMPVFVIELLLNLFFFKTLYKEKVINYLEIFHFQLSIITPFRVVTY